MNTKEIWKDMWYKTCNQIVEINNKVFVSKKSLKRLTKLYKKVIVLKRKEKKKRKNENISILSRNKCWIFRCKKN